MKTKKFNSYHVQLDEEEQEISDTIGQGKLKSVDNLEEELAFAKEAAANYFCKDAHINIRLSRSNLSKIK